jgi:hypothetical protein
MKKFQYQIVRYIHDRITAEFVNVGIVIYQPESNFIGGKFINKFSRVSHFFTEINGQYLISTLRQFEHELNHVSKRLGDLFSDYSSITEITNAILPKDDSSLECSEIFFAIDLKPQSALEDLFSRLIDKYNHELDNDHHDDTYVWRKVYKQYFDKYGITSKLKPHIIKTANDDFEFDKAWKNGVWNCYQTLSFDLKRNDSIKNKVYKWSGILSEIEQSNQEIHLYFLTVNPSKDRKINHFIRETLVNKSRQTIKVTMVDEDQADSFVAKVKKEIEAHIEA